MKIHTTISRGMPLTFEFLDITEDELKLISKSLHTNWNLDNFISVDEEELCESLLQKISGIAL